jgi:hypothetical protein
VAKPETGEKWKGKSNRRRAMLCVMVKDSPSNLTVTFVGLSKLLAMPNKFLFTKKDVSLKGAGRARVTIIHSRLRTKREHSES